MSDKKGSTESGPYSKLIKYISDPTATRLLLDSAGDLRLVDRLARQNLIQSFFGIPSLDKDTTLKVLVAVKRFLRKGDFDIEDEQKVVHMAQQVLRSIEADAPLQKGLGDTFQEAIVQFVRQNRLQRAVLVEEETILQWERPVKDHSLREDLLSTQVAVTGRAAKVPLLPPLKLSTPDAMRRFLAVLVANFSDAVDLEPLEGIEDMESLMEALANVVFEPCKSMRLLKAIDQTLLLPLKTHMEEVLMEVIQFAPRECKLTMDPGQVMIYFEPNSVVVRRTIQWCSDPEEVSEEDCFRFDCSLTMVFDRLLRRCRKVDTKVCAPEFGKNLPLECCGHLTDLLAQQFPFTY